MKRYLLAVLLLGMVLSATAQNPGPWTSFRIAERWSYESIPVPEIKGKPGIVDFAVAFADKYAGNVIWDAVKQYLTIEGYTNEDVDEFVLDRPAGYLSIDFMSNETVAAEMCYWSVPNGRHRLAVKVSDFAGDSMPRLYLYEYLREEGILKPCSGEPEGLIYGDIVNFVLPRKGKDIEVVKEYGPSDWIRFDAATGKFTYESSAPVSLGCYISDKSATNVRRTPGGTVVGQIAKPGVYSLSVCNPKNGWWQILNGVVYENMDGETLEFEGEVWVHSSVLGLGTRNYGGETLTLRTEPRADAPVAGTINGEVEVRPLDLSEDGAWVKVRWGQVTGWIESNWLCSNPLTNCS